jgi:hypothetical protein
MALMAFIVGNVTKPGRPVRWFAGPHWPVIRRERPKQEFKTPMHADVRGCTRIPGMPSTVRAGSGHFSDRFQAIGSPKPSACISVSNSCFGARRHTPQMQAKRRHFTNMENGVPPVWPYLAMPTANAISAKTIASFVGIASGSK